MSSLNDLLKKLEVFSNSDQHEQVAESSLEILKGSPHDSRALRLTVVSLINLDKYQQALQILKQYSQADTKDEGLLLEKLYIYYKLNLNKELGEAFDKLENDSDALSKGLLHLKAQFYYKLGKYSEALEIYQNLISNTSSGDAEWLDLIVNERAVVADAIQLDNTQKFQLQTPSSTTSYDSIFNDSLIEFGLHNYSKSLELLDLAEVESKNNNPDPIDQFNELLPILIQKAYVYEVIGDNAKALEILSQIDPLKISDSLNKLIYDNNWISLSNPNNLISKSHLIYKELTFPNSINNLRSRLSIIQHSKLLKNYIRLSLYIGKQVGKIDDGSISVSSRDYTLKAITSLYKADIIFDKDDGRTRARKAFRYAQKQKTIGASLAAAQLNVEIGNFDAAIGSLELLEDGDKQFPGVSSIYLKLVNSLESSKSRKNLTKKNSKISETFKLLRDRSLNDLNNDEYEFLKTIALKFYEREPVESKQLLKSLNEVRKDDLISLALGESDQDLSTLESISELHSSPDIEDLISQGVEQLSQKHASTKIIEHKVKKRIHKRKQKPLNYEESKEVDPERWLPLKDRSYYKPKKGKKKNLKDTQGGVADNSTEQNLVSNVVRSSPAPSSSKKTKKKGRK